MKLKFTLLTLALAFLFACGGSKSDKPADQVQEVTEEMKQQAEEVANELDESVKAIEKTEAELDKALEDL